MTLDDKAHIDEVVSELKALRLKYLTELNKTLALGEKVKAAYLRGEVDESFLASICTMMDKKSAELQTADALLDAVNVPATPHNTQLYMDLVNLLARIGETDGFYSSLPGQNPVVDQMFAELKAKTKELNKIVRADLARRKDKELEKDMSRLGFALGLLLFK